MREKLALLKKEVAKIDEKYRNREKTQKSDVELKPEKLDALVICPPGFSQVETCDGTAFFRDACFSHCHRHGDSYLREALEIPGDVFSFLGQDNSFGGLDLKRCLFLDTETTGLAGGSGTLAFLIGVGFFDEENFTVRQYFVPDYKFEGAILQHLKGMLDSAGGLVTFNGRSFDLPLVNTRMIMNRIRPGSEPLHLDLLFPARRFWKGTLESCSLSSLERNLLKFSREDDVPGALIPEMYFRYIRDREFEPMEKVLHHNLLDIISMVTLLVRMWSHLEMAGGNMLRGSEYYSLGRIYEKRGECENAADCFQKALGSGDNTGGDKLAGRRLSKIYKKENKWDEAVSLWNEMADGSNLDESAHLELAKYYEHRMKDYEKALRHTDLALEIVYRKRSIGAEMTFYKERGKLQERALRLKKKMEKRVDKS